MILSPAKKRGIVLRRPTLCLNFTNETMRWQNELRKDTIWS